MAYDQKLAKRIRAVLRQRKRVREIHMMGGIAFMVAGSMACGIIGKELMARVGRDAYDEALEKPHVHEMKFTGRALRGFVLVRPKGIRTRASLAKWVDQASAFAASLERKKRASRK